MILEFEYPIRIPYCFGGERVSDGMVRDYRQLHDPNAEYTMRELSAGTMGLSAKRDGRDVQITDVQTTMVDGNFPWTLVRIYTDAGIVGTGRIGLAVVRILAGFGCRLLAHDPSPDPACEALGAMHADGVAVGVGGVEDVVQIAQ